MAVNLIGTPVEDLVEDSLRGLAQGNEGYVDAQVLELDGTKLRMKVKVRHKHKITSWPTTIWAYKITTWVEGNYDVVLGGSLKICAGTPVGDFLIST